MAQSEGTVEPIKVAVITGHHPFDVRGFAELFRGLDGIFSLSRAFVAPHLMRHLPERESLRVAELLARLVVTHLLEADDFMDLGDRRVVEALVRTRILPGLSVNRTPAHT